ncbi:unnamed protein product [Calypogeia fissa]
MADLSTTYGESLFTAGPQRDPSTLAKVLQAQRECLIENDKQRMEEPVMVEELFTAASSLAHNWTPGPDGTPVEFLLALWPLLGPLITAILQEAIAFGSLHEVITRGTIILLHKRGLLEILSNKRTLTMLNTIYNIFTKLYQLW